MTLDTALEPDWIAAINDCGIPFITKVTAQSQKEGKTVTLNFMRDSIIVGEKEHISHKDVVRLLHNCLGALPEFPDSITLHFK